MSAKSGGSVVTFLMSVPLAAIPLMAIFGIPQFAPVSASPDHDDELPLGEAHAERDIRDRYRNRSSDLLDDREDEARSELLNDAPVYDPFQDEQAATRQSVELGSPRDRTAARGDPRRSINEAPATAAPLPALNDHRRRPTSGWEDETRNAHDHVNDTADPGTSETALAEGSVRLLETGDRKPDSSPAMTWRDASRELSDRGIENFRLERGRDAESFLFVCTLAPGGNRNVTMRFEAEAAEPLAAVVNVLEQVDTWLRDRFAATRGIPAVTGATP
jgi:hypothetical protein